MSFPLLVEQPAALLHAVLESSPTAVALLRPLYEAATNTLTDFACEYLNPAGQRLLGQSPQPAASWRTLFPPPDAAGVFATCQQALLPDVAPPATTASPAPHRAGNWEVTAQRQQHLVVVHFARCPDAAPPQTSPPASSLGGTAPHQQELARLFAQAPVAIAVFRGPQHRIELANDLHLALWGRTREQVLGRPLFEALPEAAGIGYEQLLGGVLTTGQPYVARDLSAPLVRNGVREDVFFDFIYHPLYEADGPISGVVVVAHDTTAQVRSRQQVQTLNQELATSNEKLRATNEEHQTAIAALREAQQQLHRLNQDLEGRVQERTRQLTQQSHRLERLLAEAPAAIATLAGPDLVFEFLNADYQALFPGRLLLGKPVLVALPELVGSGLDAVLRGVYETGTTFAGTDVLISFARPGDGQLENRYFNFIYQARYAPDGRTDGLVLFGFEVTEAVQSRQQREALQAELLAATQRQAREREAQQQQLQQIFAQAPVAIAILRGPTYWVEMANARYLELIDRPASQFVGRPQFEAIPEAAGQGFEPLLAAVMATGQPYQSPEITVRLRRQGQLQDGYFQYVYTPLREPDGHISGVVVVFHELTEQVRARQQVQALNQALASSNEQLTATNAELYDTNTRLTRTNADLDNFVYTASHDLRSPISNIEGLLALLPEVLPDAVRQDELVASLLTRMQESITRFIRTIGHLTEVSKLQAEFAQPTIPVPLAALIEDVRQDLLLPLTEARAELTVAVDGCEPRVFSPKNLRSLLYNLLSNALKYRAPDRVPRVRVACARVGDELVLTVQDNGLGLSEGQQTRLFQLFQRLHTHVEGSGVGLYMVKKIVEQAGGTIAVVSQEGIGTTFTLRFPA